MKKTNFKFPEGFLWGTATSAYQVEGSNFNNDWWKWENSSKRIRKLKEQGKNPQDFISGRTCDQYHLYKKDFDLIRSLNNNAYRFSIEWSRVEPEEGRFSDKEIEHYRKLIEALLQRGIEPFITLWHFTNPLWFIRKGGWGKKKNNKYFLEYVDRIIKELGNLATFWIPINEPEIYTYSSYLEGRWPPQEKSFLSFLKIIHNFIEVHRESYKIIKKVQPQAQIGIATNNTYYEVYQNKIISNLFKKIIEGLDHFYILDRIKNYQDFIGLNYYFHCRVKGFKFNQNENKNVSDIGWEIYPEGIYQVLKRVRKFGKPIYITENGVADVKDKIRPKFIIEHLKWIHKAIQEGIDVKGYFYWSLLDNFEWRDGFWPRFGLFEVDYKSLKRIPRKSAKLYSEICRNNGICDNMRS